jgi:hypothetical protein
MTISDSFTASFIFKFQMIVAGKIAKAKSVAEFTAEN